MCTVHRSFAARSVEHTTGDQSGKLSINSTIPTYEQDELKGRPTSPHVTIYNFPMPTLMSITHRLYMNYMVVCLYCVDMRCGM